MSQNPGENPLAENQWILNQWVLKIQIFTINGDQNGAKVYGLIDKNSGYFGINSPPLDSTLDAVDAENLSTQLEQ